MARLPLALIVGLLAVAAPLLAACGRAGGQAPRVPWSTALAWGDSVAVGHDAGRPVGPLAVAVEPGRVAVLDSFGERVLEWSYSDGIWHGPATLPVPTRSALLTLALAPVGSSRLAVVGDAAGTVWALTAASPARPILDLPSTPGDLRRVVSLVALPDGIVVADVVEITAARSARVLLAIGVTGGVRTVAEALLGRSAASAPDQAWLFPPAGFRAALAPAPAGLWLAAGARTSARLVRIGLNGRPVATRTVPGLPAPVDFLGVNRDGLGYAVAATGTPQARLVAFNPGGRVVSSLALPPGDGPALPHPAAVDAAGDAVILSSSARALQVRFLPPGIWRKAA